MQYTDIALAAVLCSIAQVLVAKTTTTPHLIGGKTLHRSLEFFYSLTCKGRLWAITSPIRIMFTSSQWRSKKPTWVATTLVYIYINVLIHLTSHQCIYLVNLRHCTPNRSAHYIQKSSDFFDVLLLSSFLYRESSKL